MSYLKDKSDVSIEAANCLIKEKLYSSSIHCSYYGCYQLILHTFKFVFLKSEENIKNDKGSHNFIINSTMKEIFDRTNKEREYEEYRKIIFRLKALRKKADYENIFIKPDEAKQAFTLAGRYVSFLTKEFNL